MRECNRWEELVSRFEEPDSGKRWDNPLFTVLPDDTEPPFEDIWMSTMMKKAAAPNMSTAVVPIYGAGIN